MTAEDSQWLAGCKEAKLILERLQVSNPGKPATNQCAVGAVPSIVTKKQLNKTKRKLTT